MEQKSKHDKADGFTLELYKSLRAEANMYVEKVPGLWLQKFILIGAVIAFLVGKHEDLAKVSPGNTLLIAAIISVPILAILLDAKILEYGLHARAISRFIRANFPEPSILARWEASLWGDEGEQEITELVRVRRLTTVVVTVAPTAVLIVLSGLVIGEIRNRYILWMSLAGSGATIYLAVTWYVWRKVWPSA